jgi:hypothetical protein
MKILRSISKTPWVDMVNTSSLLDVLQAGAKHAWEILSHPKIILEEVLDNRGSSYTEDEVDTIYKSLRATVYETTEQVFYASLDKELDKISYSRNAKEINRLWTEKSKFKTVREWCNRANCPIAWLFDDSDAAYIATITAVQDGKTVRKNELESALSFLQNTDLVILFNTKAISNSFFANIGEAYRAAFETDGKTLYSRLKTNGKLTADVYTWSSKIPEIKKVLNEFLNMKHKDEAKKRVSTMSDSELRDDVLRLLDDNPELCSYFLKI